MAVTALLYHLLFWFFESLPYYWELFHLFRNCGKIFLLTGGEESRKRAFRFSKTNLFIKGILQPKTSIPPHSVASIGQQMHHQVKSSFDSLEA